MQIETSHGDRTDQLVRSERRGIWLALIVVVALAATLVLGSDTRRALLTAVAIGIVFGVSWVNRGRTKATLSLASEQRKAVMLDELRQVAINRAFKSAFVAMLGGLSAFCLLSTVVDVGLSAPMIAALAVALGAITFLSSFLLFDRA